MTPTPSTTAEPPLPPCPACGSSNRLRILYGFPTPEAFEASERGEFALGGCVIGPESPDYECRDCGVSLPWVAHDVTDGIRAAVYGHLVGDAIGVPYEFTDADPRRLVELRGYGTHHQPPGTWSDDGALMLALLDSLLSVGFDPEDQGRRALAWADAKAYTPDGDGAFDIGGATSGALSRLRAGTPAIDAGGTGRPRPGQRLAHAHPAAGPRRATRRTTRAGRAGASRQPRHARPPNCQVACALYVLVARTLRDRPDGDPEAALAQSVDRLLAVYAGQPTLRGDAARAAGASVQRKKPGGGWVLDSFWSAWEAFAAGTSYRDVIERCVRYGLDTDTTAAIAGGLAGLRWGLDEARGGIPGEWLDGLRGKEIVEELLARCAP